MKTSITLAALLLLLGTGVFAAAPAKTKGNKMNTREQVSFIPLHGYRGFAVRVDKQVPGKSMVIVYDQDQNVVYKDCLTKGTEAEKKYILSQLSTGDYTVEVYSKTH